MEAIDHIVKFFLGAYQGANSISIALEAIAFVFGVVSVWYAKRAHIAVYPTGLIATLITVYLLYVAGYYGDMMMNAYYSLMSIYGWWNWSHKNDQNVLVISKTNLQERWIGMVLCFLTMLVTYLVYLGFGRAIEWVNYIDVVTSGIFFTAMWYMAQKKVENWTLWIIANVITVPLYAYRGLGMLSLQYMIFTVLAVQGYRSWNKQYGADAG